VQLTPDNPNVSAVKPPVYIYAVLGSVSQARGSPATLTPSLTP